MPAALGEEGAIVQRAGYRADLDSADLGGEALFERARMARSFLLRALASRPRDAIGICLAIAGVAAVSINALYLQPGPHPAPIFAIKSRTNAAAAVRVPRPRPGDLAKVESSARPQSVIIADIQRELERRGFYEGPIDGFHGPRTDAAIRDFEQAAGFKLSGPPSEELLQTILHSTASSVPASQPHAPPSASASARGDAIRDLIAGSSHRMLAVQRALADFGYGPVKPTGVAGPETRAAIEKFERDRKLPVTGQLSDRLVRELAAVTGRPLE
jgi:peptidoglycan hydrolase-like protein with peptidoglycan-binding domain